MPVVDRRYCGVADAATYLGLTPKAIYDLVARRKIPFIKVGKSVRFDLKRLDQWMAGRAGNGDRPRPVG